MRSRLSWFRMKSARRMAIILTSAAMTMTGLPAASAQHAVARRSTPSSYNNPFAQYETALDSAAAQTLKHIDMSPAVIPASRTAALPETSQITPTSPAKVSQSARQRVDRLLSVIEPILKRTGIPVQLAAVVLIESGGNPTALSPKGARGLWQLMPQTAREYGLIVNGKTDQRLDIIKSTRAAAEYLRDLYAEFHNWKLALAAYNAGEQTVHRAMALTGANAFASAAKALPAETQNYVPAVFHALAWFGGNTLSPPRNQARLQQIDYAYGE